jgi:hypothetical protein
MTPPSVAAEPDARRAPAHAPAGVPWWLVLTSLTALAAACPLGRRRSIALGLILLLAVFAAESGVHSAHHLDDAAAGQSCQAAAAAQHLSGTDGAPAVELAVELAAVGDVPPPASASAPTRADAPHSGRAPPARPA